MNPVQSTAFFDCGRCMMQASAMLRDRVTVTDKIRLGIDCSSQFPKGLGVSTLESWKGAYGQCAVCWGCWTGQPVGCSKANLQRKGTRRTGCVFGRRDGTRWLEGCDSDDDGWFITEGPGVAFGTLDEGRALKGRGPDTPIFGVVSEIGVVLHGDNVAGDHDEAEFRKHNTKLPSTLLFYNKTSQPEIKLQVKLELRLVGVDFEDTRSMCQPLDMQNSVALRTFVF